MPPEADITLLAEFADDATLLACAGHLRRTGLTRLELFSPFALPKAAETLGLGRSRIPAAMFMGGLCGGVVAYLLQWWTTVVAYPLRVGGMPMHSVPAFIPITFETIILAACLTGFLLVLARSGLPRLWHPCFDVPGFQQASRTRFFLAVACSTSYQARLEQDLRSYLAVQVSRLDESAA